MNLQNQHFYHILALNINIFLGVSEYILFGGEKNLGNSIML